MMAAIIKRHSNARVIIEIGRKIIGTYVSPGYRRLCTGGWTGMKTSVPEYRFGWYWGRFEGYESGLVGLNLNNGLGSKVGEERCFLANASSSLVRLVPCW